MKRIPLTQGKSALIDDEDLDLILHYRWYARKARKTWYAVSKSSDNGKESMVWMHRLIMNPPIGYEVDHADLDGLNNRRLNLRIATHAEQNANKRKIDGCSSPFKGVSWREDRKKWAARIKTKGKLRHLGLFENIIDAARAYDSAARETFGEFARTNFIIS